MLIRALEPMDGRRADARRGAGWRDADLCNGPGKLTQALGVELTENDDVAARRARPHRRRRSARPSSTGVRIGITKAAELPWRFCAAGSRHVSRPWPMSA